jgi:hypothetical protein
MDVHVPQSITDQLRRRGADVLTAIDDGWAERTDSDLLAHAHELGRIIFTQEFVSRLSRRIGSGKVARLPALSSAISSAARSGSSSRIWS